MRGIQHPETPIEGLGGLNSNALPAGGDLGCRIHSHNRITIVVDVNQIAVLLWARASPNKGGWRKRELHAAT